MARRHAFRPAGAGAAGVLALALAGCASGPGRPPPIAEGAPLEAVHDTTERSPGWTARLNQRFPPGTPAARVAAVLAGEGFAVDAAAGIATYRWSRFPCANFLKVRWRTGPDGAVTAIEGSYADACT